MTLQIPGGSPSKLVQIVSSFDGAVQTGATTTPKDDTQPQQATETNLFYTRAITPRSLTNRLLIIGILSMGHSAGSEGFAGIWKDSGANPIGGSLLRSISTPADGWANPVIVDVAISSLSAQTYKLGAGFSSGTITLNGLSAGRLFGGALTSGIYIIEYTP